MPPWEKYQKPASGPWEKYAQPKASPRNFLDEVAGAAANFNRSVPGLDEIGAGMGVALDAVQGRVRSGSDLAQSWKRNRDTQQAFEEDFQGRRPLAAAAVRGTGYAATAAVPFGSQASAFANSTRLANAARGAVVAGNQAALTAVTDRGTGRERMAAASRAAVDPLTITLGAAGGAMAPARAVPKKASPISVDDLQTQKRAAYKAVEDANIQYAPDAFDGLIGDISKNAAKSKINPMRHPKAASMIEEISGMSGASPTLTELDQLRQVVRRDVASSADDAEQFFGKGIIGQIDDFIEASGPKAMVGGSAGDANTLMRSARDMNSRFRKTEAVTDALEEARLRAASTGSGGNIDNATRQRLRGVMEKTRNLTPEERAAFEKVIVGSRGQGVLRTLGKLSPQGNGLMAALNLGSAGFGGVAGGIPGVALGVAPAAVGMVSKTVSDAMTRGSVDDLLRIVSTGGATQAELAAIEAAAATAPTSAAVTALRREVAAKLARAAGAQGGAYEGALEAQR